MQANLPYLINTKFHFPLNQYTTINRQPIIFVATYDANVEEVAGNSYWPEPYYIKITRDFEFDLPEVLPIVFGYGTPNVPVTTPATIGTYTFMGWSDGVSSMNRVFTQAANVKAIYKNAGKSNYSLTLYNNSQRKIVRTTDGQLHRVYESMGKVWYERSTDNGSNWAIVGNKPISVYDSKSPAIDYYQNYVCIAYQENHDDKFDIRLLFYQNGDQLGDYRIVKANSTNINAIDASPVVAWDINNNVLVIWKDDNNNTTKLNYRFGSAFGNWYNVFNQIPNTDNYSNNPTIATKKNGTGIKYHLAYQQGEAEIRYLTLTGINNEIEFSSLINVSSQSPYSKNYKPSLVVLNINGTESVRFSWIGERNNQGVYEEELPTDYSTIVEKRTVFRALSGTVLSAYWNFGLGVSSTSINGTDDNNYVVGWSQNSGMQNQYVRNTTLSQVKSFKKNNSPLIGNDLQVANGSNFDTQYATIFNSSTSPFQLSTSDAVSILGKVNGADKINTGREGIVTKDSAHFYFSLGDITVNNVIIDYPPIADTVLFSSTNDINAYLVSEPFQLDNQSSFSYSVQYGATDSIIASAILTQNDTLSFKVQLVDELTNEILGTYDEVIFSSENPILYDNIEYEVNVNGIGSRLVRLKLIVTSTLDALYNLATKYATVNQLAKKNPKYIYFNGQEVVDNYKLSQNYPNPFNPVTKIRYQIPQSGFVTLKIFDVLGAEVKTLVNEEKIAGQYEVDFNASKLASGVYIYRIQAGDFISSKKMILLR
ncbi:MAG: T9SS type A sorting domain-containing protein [Ignavibacterium sp.]|nr:T9SS type A sorting domain-containing protein [Ignavibacterium sp.]